MRASFVATPSVLLSLSGSGQPRHWQVASGLEKALGFDAEKSKRVLKVSSDRPLSATDKIWHEVSKSICPLAYVFDPLVASSLPYL